MTSPPEHSPSSADADDWNLAIVRGRLTGPPQCRDLPGGAAVADFDLATDDGTVPVAWREPSSAILAAMQPGESVVVVGHVQRRFFRSGGRTHCRTEVVAQRVIPSRRRATVRTALARALTGIAP